MCSWDGEQFPFSRILISSSSPSEKYRNTILHFGKQNRIAMTEVQTSQDLTFRFVGGRRYFQFYGTLLILDFMGWKMLLIIFQTMSRNKFDSTKSSILLERPWEQISLLLFHQIPHSFLTLVLDRVLLSFLFKAIES